MRRRFWTFLSERKRSLNRLDRLEEGWKGIEGGEAGINRLPFNRTTRAGRWRIRRVRKTGFGGLVEVRLGWPTEPVFLRAVNLLAGFGSCCGIKLLQ